jgi:hypothetical protein
MPKYRVHLYREMRIVFDDIEADSAQAAAELASEKHFDDRDGFSDCEGVNLAALVDQEGDPDGTLIDFKDGRMLRASDSLLSCLKDVLSRFRSCIGGGNGKIEGDDEAIRSAEAAIAIIAGGAHG